MSPCEKGEAIEQLGDVIIRTTRSGRAEEEALAGGDSLLARLVRNLPGGSVNVFDRDLRYLFAAGRGLAQVGLAPEMIVGRTLWEVFPQDAADYVASYYRRAFAGETVSFDLSFGGRCYALCAAPLGDAGDAEDCFDSIIVAAQDITEREQAEVASREEHEELHAANEGLHAVNEELYVANKELEANRAELWLVNRQLAADNSDLENLIHSARLPTLFLDRYLRIRRYTPPLRELFNLTPSDIGRLVTGITHRLAYAGFVEDCDMVLDSLHPVEREVAATNGRWFIMRLLPFRASKDAIGGVVITFVDIREQKQAEARLRRQLDFIEAITAGLGEGVFVLGLDGRVTLVNGSAEVMLGWTRPEILGRLMYEVVQLHREDQASLTADALLPDGPRSGQAPKGRRYIFTRRDGTRFPVSLTASPVVTGGRLVGTALAFHDVTEEEHVKGMLKSFSQRLIEAQEAERRRVARELHDEIGQALTAIKLNLQALPTSPSSAPQLRESADIVDRALRQIRELSLDLRPSQLDDLGLVAALRWHVDRESRRAGLISEFVADLPETRLPPELETACFRITQEALTNVVRHARAHRVRVELKQQGSELHLRVRDDGIGFDSGTVQTSRVSEINLGLRGMQERALIVGGRLEICSSPSDGTEVYARFHISAEWSHGSGE